MDSRYSYGWRRAEDFSPLQVPWLNFHAFEQSINIYPGHLEPQAYRKFVIVGSLGLASDIVGLFLFHGNLIHSIFPTCRLDDLRVLALHWRQLLSNLHLLSESEAKLLNPTTRRKKISRNLLQEPPKWFSKAECCPVIKRRKLTRSKTSLPELPESEHEEHSAALPIPEGGRRKIPLRPTADIRRARWSKMINHVWLFTSWPWSTSRVMRAGRRLALSTK